MERPVGLNILESLGKVNGVDRDLIDAENGSDNECHEFKTEMLGTDITNE